VRPRATRGHQLPICDCNPILTSTADRSRSSVGRNLWSRQRRGTRPCRWRGPGCWRWSRRSRRRCCRSGTGSWRGGRRRSGSGRRRRCAASHSSKNIDPAPTIDIVWRARGSALSRTDVDSRVIQRIAGRRKLMSQARNSRPHQGHCACNVRSSHGCAAEICI